MLIYSNSPKSENSCKLFNLNKLPNLYGLRRGFSNRKQNVRTIGNIGFWEICGFRKYKVQKTSPSPSDEIVVIHQTSMSQQTQLSELIEMDQLSNSEGSSSYSVESESKVSQTKSFLR